MPKIWKKGRGKLGFLEPLLGAWTAEATSPMGPLRCHRTFSRFGANYVRLDARWEFGKAAKAYAPSGYEELALIGVGDDKKVCVWSFTSDGKRSAGTLADVQDVHPEAFGFEAKMPAGIARMIYWPDPDGGFRWAVEAKGKKGWRRFTEHHYKSVAR